MDKKEKHVMENESIHQREAHRHSEAGQAARSLPAEGRRRKRESTRKTNRLWLWLGVLILIFILIYWLFTIGLFEDMMGYFNG